MSNRKLKVELSALASKGYAVIPTRGKAPFFKNWYEQASTDANTIAGWVDRYGSDPKTMWGVACGKKSGNLLCIDVDVPTPDKPDKPDGMKALMEYAASIGEDIPPTMAHRSPSGGWHLFYIAPEGVEIKNGVGILPGVDIRYTGGQVIAPPSVNEDGVCYTVYNDADPVAAPDWLLRLVCDGGKPKTMPTIRDATQGAHGPESREVNYARKALADEVAILSSMGRDTGRNPALNVAACKMFGYVASGLLLRDEVRNALIHAMEVNGSVEDNGMDSVLATLKSAEEKGMQNPRMPEARLETDIIPGNGPSLEPEPWADPVPFDGMNTPDIKKEWLPPVLADYCSALAEEKQVPFGLAFGMAISALAGVAQLRFKVNVRQGYSEGLNLYVICPLDPGNRKSAVVDSVLHPIRAWEKAQAVALAPEIRRVESLRKTMEAAIAERRKKAATAGDLSKMEAIQREIDEMEERLPEVPHVPRITADDTTPEALAVIMQGNWNAVIIVSAEGGIFDILAGRYSKAPNLDLFLKGHSGDMVRVDRKNGPPVLMDEPRITMGLSPQPCVLMRRQASEEFRGRGVDGRFAYLVYKTMLGRRKAEPDPMPEPIKTAYHQLIYRLLPESMEGDRPEQIALTLDDDAYAVWLEFCEKVEAELRPGGQFDGMTDWGGKLTGLVVRLAGLMHLADGGDAGKSVINGSTMEGAVLLGFVLADHARAAYALMGTDTATERGKALLDWIRRSGIRSFSERDCFNEVRGQTTFSHVEGVREGLSELKERGFVREAIMPKRTGPGRSASQVWEVNPATMEA